LLEHESPLKSFGIGPAVRVLAMYGRRRRAILIFFLALMFWNGKVVAESFSDKKGTLAITPNPLASIPNLPQVIPRPHFPGKSIPAWQPKWTERDSLIIESKSVKQNFHQGLYNWLCHQQNSLTGLVESFDGSSDPMLKDQAATYDQALAGIAFLMMGDGRRAEKILDFFVTVWRGKGFYTFYSSLNGRVGVEWRRHVGPNMWLAIFIYQYEEFTKDASYRFIAEGLCDWVISLPHYNGGPAMSDVDEPNIPWREIVSTENVIDVVAVLQMAIPKVSDFRKKKWYEEELIRCRRFLRDIAIQSDGMVFRGYRPFIDGIDKTPALDTVTWLIATSLPQNIEKEYGVSLEKLLSRAESQFGIQHQHGYGFDFTSKEESIKTNRSRICSIEWTCEMASVYWLISKTNSFSAGMRDQYREKYIQVLKGIDGFVQKVQGLSPETSSRQNFHSYRISYPYASDSFKLTFSDGWYTPKARADGSLAGSVASTCWRLFANLLNPLRLDPQLSKPKIKVNQLPYKPATKKEIQKAKKYPSSLTSEGLTTAAWLNLNSGNKEAARKYALRSIHIYSKLAKEQQATKAAEGGLVRANFKDENVKQRIFKYSALNDVAACWFILSRVDSALLLNASQTVHRNYSLAQVWDPAGHFWSVADALPKKN